MIRFIAAVDSKRGMADDHGIPWQGKVPTDVANFRKKTEGNTVLMGYGTYIVDFKEAILVNRRNLVASMKKVDLRPGFELVQDARKFLRDFKQDIWVIGGPTLFAQTLDLADELYLTQLMAEFSCTKFFPKFQNDFKLVSESDSITENGITYTFQVWKNKRIT